jgi:hypothetical protein
MAKKTGAALRREEIKNAFFPKADLWLGESETGYAPVPRTLPLILSLIGSKELSGNKNPSSVYLELFCRPRSDGIIEMSRESEHAFAAGYVGSRAVRTWQERMRMLEKLGFIQIHQAGNEKYKYVALLHPTTAIQKLRESKKIPEPWWSAYIARKFEIKEPTHEKRQQAIKDAINDAPSKVIKSLKTKIL